MDLSIFGISWALIEQACLLLVVFVLLFHIKYFRRMLTDRATVLDQVVLSILFGAYAIFGTYSGVATSGAIANIRNLGPMMGGLLAGPWVGLASGLIGGIHRYFMGGFTCLPCAIGTTLSGLFAGLLWLFWKGKFGIWKPALFAFIMEIIDMGLLLLIARPFENALKLVNVIAVPMILGDTVGVAIFAFLIRHIKMESKA